MYKILSYPVAKTNPTRALIRTQFREGWISWTQHIDPLSMLFEMSDFNRKFHKLFKSINKWFWFHEMRFFLFQFSSKTTENFQIDSDLLVFIARLRHISCTHTDCIETRSSLTQSVSKPCFKNPNYDGIGWRNLKFYIFGAESIVYLEIIASLMRNNTSVSIWAGQRRGEVKERNNFGKNSNFILNWPWI